MNRGMAGAFEGLGQGIARAGEMAYGSHLSERAEQRRIELQAKLRGEERAEDREFKKEMAAQANEDAESRIRLQASLQKENAKDTQVTYTDEYDKDGKLIGQRASTGRLEIFPPVKATMDPALKIQLEEVRSQADHLRKMERDIRTKKTDEFGNVLVDDTNRDQILQEIRERQAALAQEFNSLLGKTKATPAESSILSTAITLPEEDRAEYMADLQESGKADPALIAAIEALWAPDPAESELTTAADAQTPKTGGMIEEAQGSSAPEPTKEAKPTVETKPEPEPEPAAATEKPPYQQPNDWRERKLGPMLESGMEKISAVRDEAIQKRAQESIRAMEQVAVSSKPLSPQEKVAFLQRHGAALKYAPPEVREQMIEIFGENMLTPYLN